MSKKKDSETATSSAPIKKKRMRLPRLPKNALFAAYQGEDGKIIFLTSPDLTDGDFANLMVALQAIIDANTEPMPEIEHYGFGPPPS